MNFKKIYGLILGVIVAGLTSCSSDLNNEEKAPVSPNETAKRTLSISTGDAKTRSEVRIDADNKWVTGDKFMAYNRTFTGSSSESRYGMLTASNGGTRTTLEGDIACKDDDELGIFYPGTFVAGFDQGKMPVVMTKSYINGNKAQDGSVENLKYFDYSYGKGKVTVNGTSASGSVDMKKLYSVLELDFTADGVKLTNIKKLVLSNVYTEAVYNIPNNGLEDYETGAIEVNSPVELKKVYVAILPQNHFSPTFEVYTTDNKSYRFAVSTPNFNLVAAKVYPFTVQVQEFTPAPVNPPYIEINGIKWGKSNLQYTPGSNAEGWRGGFHLAENPWDYFYTQSNPMIEQDNVRNVDDNSEFDHFRWGDISYAYDYSYNSIDVTNHYDKSSGSIMKKNENNEFGDLPYYASNGNWRLPTQKDYEDLMSHTAQYIGYYSDGTNDILGVLFVPKPSNPSEIGYTVTKDGKTNRVANSTISLSSLYKNGWDTNYKKADSKLIKFTKEDISKGLFFPAAGWYLPDSKKLQSPGRQATYWTADGKNKTQAVSFTFSFNNQGQFTSSVGKATFSPTKRCLYSIRPIYIGQ